MKRLILFLATLCLLVPVNGAHAQLVNVDKHYTIKSLDVGHHRIAVKYLNAANEPIQEQLLVDINGNTQVTMNGRAISWTSLKPNMEVEVKGGLELSGHIQAKSINVVKRHV